MCLDLNTFHSHTTSPPELVSRVQVLVKVCTHTRLVRASGVPLKTSEFCSAALGLSGTVSLEAKAAAEWTTELQRGSAEGTGAPAPPLRSRLCLCPLDTELIPNPQKGAAQINGFSLTLDGNGM
eukprot:5077074-Pleurochrysis_carterae.AAC.5